jgi:hypothetical protein
LLVGILWVAGFGWPVKADEVLHAYDADVLPYHPSAGWQIFDPCNLTCAETIENGQLVLTWSPSGGNTVNYTHIFGGDPLPPPPDPPFWVEWRFASNNAIHGFVGGDGLIVIGYNTARLRLEMYGDAIVSGDGGTFVTRLPLNHFRTFRFESPDANQWCIWFDGTLFQCGVNGRSPGLVTLIQMYGHGESPTQTINRWDYVRYGRLTTGETIIAADPPAGYLDPVKYSTLDRFTVTFDQPNYVYVNDVVVDVEGNQATRQQGNGPHPDPLPRGEGVAGGPHPDPLPRGEGDVATMSTTPVVIATRRRDNGPPETVEIVLDRPLPVGVTVRFTFNTGAATAQTVEYTVAIDPHPVIPAVSTWGVLVLALSLLIAAKLYGQRYAQVWAS